MEIEKITITKEELHKAVESYLKGRGVTVKVTEVTSRLYPYSLSYSVFCEVTPEVESAVSTEEAPAEVSPEAV